MISIDDLWNFAPLLIVSLTGVIILIVEGSKSGSTKTTFWLSILGIFSALVMAIINYSPMFPAINGFLQHGGYANFLTILFLVSGFLTILILKEYFERLDVPRSELYALIFFAISGMILMASALDLIIIFLGIEVMSVCLYILVGSTRKKLKSNESALKYFLLGAFATGFLLYGIALIYGTTGTTSLNLIAQNFDFFLTKPLFLAGAALLIIAFSFKVAAVPFHMWVPDVYEGAPTPITAFMSTGAKAAAFGMFLIVFVQVLNFGGTKISQAIAMLSAISMVVGNVIAISQQNVKRMLAYSSIAHAGYILSGIAAANEIGKIGVLFYLTAYTFMNLGAFTIVALMEAEEDKKLTFDDYSGLSKSHPVLAALTTLFMFALTGIPPFAGFVGKYYVFLSAVKAEMVWLAVVGVLASLVSAYYYLRLVVIMYFKEGVSSPSSKRNIGVVLALFITAFFVFQLGVYPSVILDLAGSLF